MDDLIAYVTCQCREGRDIPFPPLSSTNPMRNGQAWVRFQHHYVAIVQSLSRLGFSFLSFFFYFFLCRHVIWTSVKPDPTVVWHCTIRGRRTTIGAAHSKWSCASDGFKRAPNSCVNPTALLCVGPTASFFISFSYILQQYVMQNLQVSTVIVLKNRFKTLSSFRIWRILTMVYNTQNYWVYRLCPSTGIVKKTIPVTGLGGL
jgi:hypothetical protein